MCIYMWYVLMHTYLQREILLYFDTLIIIFFSRLNPLTVCFFLYVFTLCSSVLDLLWANAILFTLTDTSLGNLERRANAFVIYHTVKFSDLYYCSYGLTEF